MDTNELACEECGTTDPQDEVREFDKVWYAGGRNAFSFNWYEYEEKHQLCGNCEDIQFEFCEECGARIEWWYYGHGYLPDDYEDEYICPGCALKKGFDVDVNIEPIEKEAI